MLGRRGPRPQAGRHPNGGRHQNGLWPPATVDPDSRQEPDCVGQPARWGVNPPSEHRRRWSLIRVRCRRRYHPAIANRTAGGARFPQPARCSTGGRDAPPSAAPGPIGDAAPPAPAERRCCPIRRGGRPRSSKLPARFDPAWLAHPRPERVWLHRQGGAGPPGPTRLKPPRARSLLRAFRPTPVGG